MLDQTLEALLSRREGMWPVMLVVDPSLLKYLVEIHFLTGLLLADLKKSYTILSIRNGMLRAESDL